MKSRLPRPLDRPRCVVQLDPMPSKQVHKESVLVLECQTMEEERQVSPHLHGGLWGGHGILLATELEGISGPLTAPNWWCANSCPSLDVSYCPVVGNSGWRTSTCSPYPNSARDASTTTGTKCWHHSSDQDVPALRQEEKETVELDYTPEELPCQKWKERRPVAKALKEPHHKAFSKELAVMRMARQAYYKTHRPNFKQKGSDDLSSTFQQMATSANLLGTDIYGVQEDWGGRRDLWATNQLTKSSSKDIHFFMTVVPTELPKIMGLEGIPHPRPCDDGVA